MKKLFAIVAFLIATKEKSNAQLYHLPDKFLIGYEAAFPGGDFLTKASWVGGRIEYRRMINPNVSVGLGGSWNSFEQYVPKTTYQKPGGTGAVTTDLVKEIYTVPLTLSGHYYWDKKRPLVPYIGLGLGAQYSDQTLYYNIFATDDNNWGFVMRPEIGAIYSFNEEAGLFLSAAYNYGTNKNDAVDINSLHHVAVTIGFIFSSR